MKKKIFSLLLVVCLMIAFTTSVYGSSEVLSTHGDLIIREFLLDSMDGPIPFDYINLFPSYIGEYKNVIFSVVIDQPNADFGIGLNCNDEGGLAYKSFKSSAFGQTFKNVLDSGKSYRLWISNWSRDSKLSGKIYISTF